MAHTNRPGSYYIVQYVFTVFAGEDMLGEHESLLVQSCPGLPWNTRSHSNHSTELTLSPGSIDNYDALTMVTLLSPLAA